MKIAFIHNLPSGGGKRSAFEFVRHLTKNHVLDLHHIDAASEDYLDLRPMMDRTFLVPGPKPKGGIGVLTSILPTIRAYKAVAERVNAGGYDVAFVMQCKLSNSPAVLRHLRIPSLYFCHEPLARTLEAHFWTDVDLEFVKKAVVRTNVQIDRLNARHATMICANSRFSVESIYRAYGVYSRYSQLGVDATTFRPLGLPRERFVLSVGALHPVKAQDLIIEAIGTLEERPPLRFIHNSAAPGYKDHLLSVAARCGVDVSFSQLVNDETLVDAYNRAAVVAFPSSLEPFGFVPLEAMSCGTPIVGVAEGGVRETVVHAKTGFLADRNASDYGRAIGTLLGDPVLADRMGHAGRQHVLSNWTWEQAAAALETHLMELLAQASPEMSRRRDAERTVQEPTKHASLDSGRESGAW